MMHFYTVLFIENIVTSEL